MLGSLVDELAALFKASNEHVVFALLPKRLCGGGVYRRHAWLVQKNRGEGGGGGAG